ncbi:hypothetical protein SAMN05421788_103402 [Filimonas lacunae]|uniref:Uncharacterized protein n=1 Tax=Filimonas lacunae TaxID=477680 RepID=A0A173MKD6_9BACT|nr:hypothetical protein [Filimonas lacunae]BAV08064.1 hypothetical protein FLA_4097 [Filimonas lacunae]SIT08752.1 hypothetical protein SAMN05421788_103402 [Filimonas lacunae]
MAKQLGPIWIKGTIGGVNFYVANGEGLARISNPPGSKRVKTAPEFAGLRQYAHWLKIASPLASTVYQALPSGKQRKHYQQLAGKAILWLKQGHSTEEVLTLLQAEATTIIIAAPPVKTLTSPKRKSRFQKLDKKYAPARLGDFTKPNDDFNKLTKKVQFLRSRKWNTRRANRLVYKALLESFASYPISPGCV